MVSILQERIKVEVKAGEVNLYMMMCDDNGEPVEGWFPISPDDAYYLLSEARKAFRATRSPNLDKGDGNG